MKKLILLALLIAATATAQTPAPGGWASVGQKNGTNWVFAVVPWGGKLTTLEWWSDAASVPLVMLWPTQAMSVTATTAATLSNVTVSSATGIPEGADVILWSRSNNVYNVFECLAHAVSALYLSNKSEGGSYGALSAPVRSNDMVYVCSRVQLGLRTTNVVGPGFLTGNPLMVGPNGWPFAFSMYVANNITNFHVNAWGSK